MKTKFKKVTYKNKNPYYITNKIFYNVHIECNDIDYKAETIRLTL